MSSQGAALNIVEGMMVILFLYNFSVFALILFNPCFASPLYIRFQADFNPLSRHNALKHHFTSLKTDLIFLQQMVLEQNFHETNLPIHGNFFQFLSHMKSCSFTTSRELRQQFAACGG